MNNNRILVISNNYKGLHCFREETLSALLSHGYRVYVSAPEDGYSSFLSDIGCEVLLTSFNRKGKNPFKDLVLLTKYYRLIKRVDPQVVLSFTIKPNVYGGIACDICQKPQIANVTGLGLAVETPGLLQKITIVLYRLGFRKTNLVFFQNQANRDFCSKHKITQGRTRLIPGSGVNLQRHSFKDYPLDGKIRFLFLGRIMKEKGIDQYLLAAESIKKEYPNTEFFVVGDCEDDYKDKLDLMHQQGIIRYMGPQIDVRPFIETCNCTVHPSFYPEGMSNVLLESCAAGRPIITTDRPGCREIVEDGVNGFIVKQRDSRDLVMKIKEFINLSYQEKKRMGLASRNLVERQFDRQIVVNAYLDEISLIH